jgi:hypothetical protein
MNLQSTILESFSKGVVEIIEPKFPNNIVSPLSVANCRASNHEAFKRSNATNGTAAPIPINPRPILALNIDVDDAKIKAPAAAARHPKNKIFLGPNVSANIPVGICIAITAKKKTAEMVPSSALLA